METPWSNTKRGGAWPSITLSRQKTDKVARSQSRWQKGGNPMGPGQQLKWGQENWKGGARKMGRKRKRTLCERSGWSITHPSLCLLFCQTSKEPKKTWWQNTQKIQECMSRGYSLCATLNYTSPPVFIYALIDFMWFWMFYRPFCDYRRPDVSEKCTSSGKLWGVLIRLNWLPAWSALWIHSSGIYHAVVTWHHSVHCSQEKLLNQTARDRRTTPQNPRPNWRI